MRYRWRMLTLSLTLAAPLVLGQIAVAQTLPATPEIHQSAPQVAHDEAEGGKELDAYFDAGYDYWDALVLANFWGEGVTDAKWRAGAKLLGPKESKLYLQICLTDARAKALGNAEGLMMFSASGYSYDDAQRFAKFWGKESAYEGKLMIERNMIMGNYEIIVESLELSR